MDFDLENKLDVMHAFKEGKHIQKRKKNDEGDWMEVFNPEWNWIEYDYRVRPLIQGYRPYSGIAEFAKDSRLHGPYLQYSNEADNTTYAEIPMTVSYEQVEFGEYSSFPQCVNYYTLLQDFLWIDGTPCGVLEVVSDDDLPADNQQGNGTK